MPPQAAFLNSIVQLVSQVVPSSGEKACSQRGVPSGNTRQRKRTTIGLPLKVSFTKKLPTPSVNPPFMGASSVPGCRPSSHQIDHCWLAGSKVRTVNAQGWQSWTCYDSHDHVLRRIVNLSIAPPGTILDSMEVAALPIDGTSLCSDQYQRSPDPDKDLVYQFIRCISIYPVGTVVELDNGQAGVVIEANPGHPLAPVVRTFYTVKYKRYLEPQVLDMASRKCERSIVGTLEPRELGIREMDFM